MVSCKCAINKNDTRYLSATMDFFNYLTMMHCLNTYVFSPNNHTTLYYISTSSRIIEEKRKLIFSRTNPILYEEAGWSTN